jgi:hypothetical protein
MAIAAKYEPGHLYAIDGATLNGLLSIAVELMASDTLTLREDIRRDYGQWIQVRLDNLDELPDEVAS